MLYNLLKCFIDGTIKKLYIAIEDTIQNKSFSSIIKDNSFYKICFLKKKTLETNKDKIITIAMRRSHFDYGFNPKNINEICFDFRLISFDLFGCYPLYQYINNSYSNKKGLV